MSLTACAARSAGFRSLGALGADGNVKACCVLAGWAERFAGRLLVGGEGAAKGDFVTREIEDWKEESCLAAGV